jgi:hypothetical protein
MAKRIVIQMSPLYSVGTHCVILAARLDLHGNCPGRAIDNIQILRPKAER